MNRIQYIVDENGKRISVVLPIRDYEKILKKLDEYEDIRVYDDVKAKNEKSILLGDYVKKRSKKYT